jgi:hypothetical protein
LKDTKKSFSIPREKKKKKGREGKWLQTGL